MKKFAFSCFLAALASLGANAADTVLGYSNGTCDRNNYFRVGKTTAQGTAIKLTGEKCRALKGCTISSIAASFQSSHTTNNTVTVFIGTNPAKPEYTQTVTIERALKWLDFALTTPYTITGDEPELYIGYTGEIATSASLLMHDGTEAAPGYCFGLKDGEWTDIAGYGWGSPNVRFTVSNAPVLTDLMLRPIATDGYFKADTQYKFAGNLFNFGTETIKSFDLSITIGNNSTVVKHYTDVDIAPLSTFGYTLDEYSSSSVGHQPVAIEVTNVNGAADSDPADNRFDGILYFYPSTMERQYVLEGFTGQACSNCPDGHAQVKKFMEAGHEDDVIEIMHHAGFQPDIFTMDASVDYTFFYGSQNTFAPASMFNRTTLPSISQVPVMSYPGAGQLENAYTQLSNMQPYVSLAVETDFDPTSRNLNIKVKTFVHNDLPYDNNIIQVALIQDGLVGKQSGAGDGYVHNNVFRGVLTGNSWGRLLPGSATKAEAEYTREFSYTIPDRILSDYWKNIASDLTNYQIDAIPENMKVVVYVGELGADNIEHHRIYNALAVKLGQSKSQGGMGIKNETSIQNEISTPQITIGTANRHIVVNGNYDSINVVTIQGRKVDPTAALAPGIYIVNVTSEGNSLTKKLIVK